MMLIYLSAINSSYFMMSDLNDAMKEIKLIILVCRVFLSSSKSKKKIERKKELINYENGHRLPYVAENIQTQCQNFHLFESLVECIQYS